MNENVQDNLPEVRNVTDLAASGQLDIEEMRSRMERVSQLLALREEFIKRNLKRGIDKDYGPIPGCGDKDAMLKPAAEKLSEWFGYYSMLTCIHEVENYEELYFEYRYRNEVRQRGTNILIAVCERECNSRESRWGRAAEKPLDIKDNVRAKAQKRAFIGGVRIATATSDIFAEEDGAGDNRKSNGGGNGENQSQAAGDFGKPISEKQCGFLYHKRKESNIDDAQFAAWLKAKYGWNSDKEIGWKAFEEILTAVKSGKLEMPASKSTSETAKPEASQQAPASSAPASGGKITVAQVKDFYMLLTSLGKSEHDFKEWLPIAMPKYEGKGVNDLQSADVDYIKEQYTMYCQGEAA